MRWPWNDCDGERMRVFHKMAEIVRLVSGICQWGTWTCIDGAPTAPRNMEARPEMCSGLDLDCDGETDEPLAQM